VACVLSVVIDGGKPFNVAVHRCAECIARLKTDNALAHTPEFELK
jgi:hypothetical protein